MSAGWKEDQGLPHALPTGFHGPLGNTAHKVFSQGLKASAGVPMGSLVCSYEKAGLSEEESLLTSIVIMPLCAWETHRWRGGWEVDSGTGAQQLSIHILDMFRHACFDTVGHGFGHGARGC